MMHKMFDEKNENNAMNAIYIATELSVFNDKIDEYQTDDYFLAASEGLNTGVEKKIFTTLNEAKAFIKTRGATWCVYEATLPRAADTSQFTFEPENLTRMHFHPHFHRGNCLVNPSGAPLNNAIGSS